MNVEAAILVAAVSGAAGLGGSLALVRAQAKSAKDEVKKLRVDLKSELSPIVSVAQEALRQASASFKAIEALRAESQHQFGKIERLDERTSFLRNTNRFRLAKQDMFKEDDEG